MKAKLQWLWADFTERVAELGTCDRLKVACAVVSPDGEHMYAFGYNGTYRGGPNNCRFTGPGRCGCVHAEQNALVKLKIRGPYVLFVTHTPCDICASLIINTGQCQAVFAMELYRDPEPWKLLGSLGITTRVLRN